MSEKWDEWYSGIGRKRSFIGSKSQYRTWKWSIINKYNEAPDNIIDVGCGDLVFWYQTPPQNYIGIDVSPVIIERNQKKFPAKTFIEGNAANLIPGISAPTVFCLDLLFHIVDNTTHQRIIENLAAYSTQWVFIYTLMYPKPTRPRKRLPIVHRYPNLQFKTMTKARFIMAGAHEYPGDNGVMYIWKKRNS